MQGLGPGSHGKRGKQDDLDVVTDHEERHQRGDHRTDQENPRPHSRPEAGEPEPQNAVEHRRAEGESQEVMEIESARIEPENAPVKVERKVEQRSQDLASQPPKFCGIEEVPPGPAGEHVVQVVKVVVRPPEPEDRIVKEPGRRGERQGDPCLGCQAPSPGPIPWEHGIIVLLFTWKNCSASRTSLPGYS